MNIFWQDLQYSARRLLRTPGFTIVAILTLVLGIGANTAIFSVVSAVLLRPLPYQDPEQLVMVWGQFPRIGIEQLGASEPEFFDIKQNVQAFSHVGAYFTRNLTLSGIDEPEVLKSAAVSAELFPVLGVEPLLGRTFRPEEDLPGQYFAILSHGFWQRRFGSDTGVLGRLLSLNDRSYTILGVMPPGFEFPDDIEVWTPLGIDPANLVEREEHFLNVLARIRPGVTLEQAESQVAALTQSLMTEHPNSYPAQSGWNLYLVPLHEEIVGDLRPTLLALLGAVGFVLLIACANVANLLLVRAQTRYKEVSVRIALGASQRHLIQQYFAESLLLSFLGAGLGLLVASWGVRTLAVTLASELPRFQEVGLDSSALLFTLGLAIFTAILMSLLPALRLSRAQLSESLKDAGGKTANQPRQQRSRNLLVIAEMAAALVLLIGAGLLISALKELRGTDPGFKSEELLTLRISLTRTRYPEPHEVNGFFQRLLQEVESLPGTSAAGIISNLPFSTGDTAPSIFLLEGVSPHEGGGPPPSADIRSVSANYFQAMGIPVLAGRSFGTQDSSDSTPVAIVDKVLAERYFPGENPVGKKIGVLGDGHQPRWLTVVGVVGSVKESELQSDAKPHVYEAYSQGPMRSVYLAVRSGEDLSTLASTVRAKVQEIDRGVPVYEVRPMQERLSQSISKQNLSALLLTLFATVAVILAAIGLYGVISYSVVQRNREFGIRMALGAERGMVLGMVIRQSAILVLIGLGIGLAMALGLTQLIRSMLYGISPTDPKVFVGAALLLTAVGLAASYVPARRTTRVDPMVTLRYD